VILFTNYKAVLERIYQGIPETTNHYRRVDQMKRNHCTKICRQNTVAKAPVCRELPPPRG